jgi:hypothetical protein
MDFVFEPILKTRLERLLRISWERSDPDFFFDSYEFVESTEEIDEVKDKFLETAEILQDLRDFIANESGGYLFTEILLLGPPRIVQAESLMQTFKQIQEFATNFPSPLMEWCKLVNMSSINSSKSGVFVGGGDTPRI